MAGRYRPPDDRYDDSDDDNSNSSSSIGGGGADDGHRRDARSRAGLAAIARANLASAKSQSNPKQAAASAAVAASRLTLAKSKQWTVQDDDDDDDDAAQSQSETAAAAATAATGRRSTSIPSGASQTSLNEDPGLSSPAASSSSLSSSFSSSRSSGASASKRSLRLARDNPPAQEADTSILMTNTMTEMQGYHSEGDRGTADVANSPRSTPANSFSLRLDDDLRQNAAHSGLLTENPVSVDRFGANDNADELRVPGNRPLPRQFRVQPDSEEADDDELPTVLFVKQAQQPAATSTPPRPESLVSRRTAVYSANTQSSESDKPSRVSGPLDAYFAKSSSRPSFNPPSPPAAASMAGGAAHAPEDLGVPCEFPDLPQLRRPIPPSIPVWRVPSQSQLISSLWSALWHHIRVSALNEQLGASSVVDFTAALSPLRSSAKPSPVKPSSSVVFHPSFDQRTTNLTSLHDGTNGANTTSSGTSETLTLAAATPSPAKLPSPSPPRSKRPLETGSTSPDSDSDAGQDEATRVTQLSIPAVSRPAKRARAIVSDDEDYPVYRPANQILDKTCSACQVCVPLAEYDAHEAACTRAIEASRSTHRSPADSAECPFCNRRIALARLDKHTEKCQAVPFQDDDDTEAPAQSSVSPPLVMSPEVSEIACPICSHSFPANLIEAHASACVGDADVDASLIADSYSSAPAPRLDAEDASSSAARHSRSRESHASEASSGFQHHPLSKRAAPLHSSAKPVVMEILSDNDDNESDNQRKFSSARGGMRDSTDSAHTSKQPRSASNTFARDDFGKRSSSRGSNRFANDIHADEEDQPGSAADMFAGDSMMAGAADDVDDLEEFDDDDEEEDEDEDEDDDVDLNDDDSDEGGRSSPLANFQPLGSASSGFDYRAQFLPKAARGTKTKRSRASIDSAAGSSESSSASRRSFSGRRGRRGRGSRRAKGSGGNQTRKSSAGKSSAGKSSSGKSSSGKSQSTTARSISVITAAPMPHSTMHPFASTIPSVSNPPKKRTAPKDFITTGTNYYAGDAMPMSDFSESGSRFSDWSETRHGKRL
ncbi:hypothetical protein CAOG_009639 [Capsaspora owczarzaki ATCC 30864]|uniref:UBZ4-type domain-containing protein n=1 Tax=Capsaspora owczarzaki (strain ATCC 30864) TaxID=595528 RepID=A0A0D2UAX5_CAPO3|nr:hypothetical protein CAOG_009639 [Capsaspora owczarzaki ATCC 30864]